MTDRELAGCALLPCPFCGNDDVGNDEGCFPVSKGYWEVRCGNPSCYAHEPSGATRDEAIERWNRRAPSRDADLQAENDRLRTALAENITSATMLRGMSVIDGGLNIGLEGGAAQLLAESFAEQFVESGAINYLELVFTHDRIGKLVVTLQRAGALTPADKTRAAEARVAELEAAIAAEEGETK